MEDNHLAKWLNGELSEEEQKAFVASADYALYKRIAEESSLLRAPEFEAEEVWNKLQEVKNEATDEQPVIEMDSTPVHWMEPFRPFLKIAAIIVVMLGISYVYLNSQATSFTSEVAQQLNLNLPDQSEVVLNAKSTLSYEQGEWEENRRLELEGEAYFKVAKGSKFTVETSLGAIAVLGTEFNVRQRKGLLEVSCFEGKVQVQQGLKKLVLMPGEAVQILDGNWEEQKVTEGAVPSWMSKESSFNSVPLKIVLNELQRQFDVDVDQDGVDLNTLFSGSFSNTDLNLALESISIPTQLRYTRDGKKVLFYATNTP